MNLWIKIENLINRLLTFLFGGLGQLLSKLTPEKLPLLIHQIKTTIRNFCLNLKTGTINALKKAKENSKNSIQDLKKIKLTNVNLDLKGEIKNLKGKNPMVLAAKPFQLFFHKLSSMEPKKALGVLGFCAFTGLSIFGIVFSSSRIYEKTRTPSSVEEIQLPGRPSYYKIDQKQVIFSTVKVPIYAQGKQDIKFLTADFDLQMSNRLSVLYIREHETMIRDHLINQVEPMDPGFTMESEGKTIIKDKLKKEINVFLEGNNVDGRVDDVNILYLLGT